MDPLDIHRSIHGFMDVDVPLGSMDVDVTNIHGYPSSAFTEVDWVDSDKSTPGNQQVIAHNACRPVGLVVDTITKSSRLALVMKGLSTCGWSLSVDMCANVFIILFVYRCGSTAV
jgi:hypothetical protein